MPSIPDRSPLFDLAFSLAQDFAAVRRQIEWCGHPLETAVEVSRGTCTGCHVRAALEASEPQGRPA